MNRRLFSAVVGLPVLAVMVWLGSSWFSILVVLLAGFAALELSVMTRLSGRRPIFLVAVGWSISMVAGSHFRASGFESEYSIVVVIGGLVFFPALSWLLFYHLRNRISWWPGERLGFNARRFGIQDLGRDWGLTVAISVYTGGLLSYAPLLRGLDQGREWVFFVLIVIFANDTAAFVTGRKIGRIPLSPKISPGKTWEGSLAGLFMSLAMGSILAYLLDLGITGESSLVLGLTIGIVAQLGDLLESRIKRWTGIKDSGWIIPGHGGVLDRLDSILFNLPLMYYFVIWTLS